MAAVGKKGGASAEINIVPLVDVVLVLLIIFMVITPLLIKEMNVQVPDKAEVESREQLERKDQIIVTMEGDRSLYLNKEPVASPELHDELATVLRSRPEEERIVFFDAAYEVNYGETMEVLDVVRGAGAHKIGVVEEHQPVSEDE